MDQLDDAPPERLEHEDRDPREERHAADPAAPDSLASQSPPRMAAAAPEPGTLGSRVPPKLNLALFALTFFSALLSCLLFEGTTLDGPDRWHAIGRATAFATSLIAILLAHEMGHFLYARLHKVDASWPYFLPAPYISFVGTFGAVIRLRSLPRSRRALIDIGASGPIFGFLVTLPVIFIGLHYSKVVPLDPTLHSWSLWDSLVTWLSHGTIPDTVGIDLGNSLAFKLCQYLQFGPLGDAQDVSLHPVALAGWFGLLVTALNLLPLGQLDGGHILYGVSPRLHRILGPPFSALLVGLGVFTPFIGWLFWGILTGTLLSRHPPLKNPEIKLSPGRQIVAVISLAIFIVSFAPVPLSMLTK